MTYTFRNAVERLFQNQYRTTLNKYPIQISKLLKMKYLFRKIKSVTIFLKTTECRPVTTVLKCFGSLLVDLLMCVK